MTHTFEQITIRPLTSKWKSRVAQFGDKWFVFKREPNRLLITERVRFDLNKFGSMGRIGSWVTLGKEIEEQMSEKPYIGQPEMKRIIDLSTALSAAIESESAHNLADALADAGLNVERRGNRRADDEAVQIEGWGLVYWDEQVDDDEGWVIRSYEDGCDYPLDDDELFEELIGLAVLDG